MVGHNDGRSLAALRSLAVVLLGGLVLAGCEGEEVRPLEPEGGEMFTSYVAMGTSNTAGFQSGGINDSTQRASYAAMVAEAMGAEFNLPLLASPGCPPPVINIYTGETVGGEEAPECGGRITPPPPVLHNVAVPGARVSDALNITGDGATPTPLTTFILGGRTQVRAAREADPTFVTVELGSNDVLEAALSGDTTVITPPSTFAQQYGAVLDSVDRGSVEGGVLIAVPDVTLIPHLSPGSAYYAADQQGAFPPTFSVHESCSPNQLGDATLVPFRYAFGQLLAQAQAGQAVELNCAADPEVLQPAEIGAVRRAVTAYNATIQAEADERDWAYVDPNPTLQQLRQQGDIPLFPNTPGASPQEAVEEPFGPYFSKDGIHPSRQLHRTFAGAVVQAINDQYDTSLSSPGS